MSEEWEDALMYNDLEAIREIANKLYEENKQLDKDAMYWIDRAYEYKHKLKAIRMFIVECKDVPIKHAILEVLGG